MSPGPSFPLRRGRRRRRLAAGCLAISMALGAVACVPTGTRGEEQSKEVLFEDRPDRVDADVDRNMGDRMKVDAFEATVTSAEFVAELGPNDKAGYIVANVTVENTEATKLETSRFHWKVLAPSGELRSHILVEGGRQGELVADEELDKGEAVSGTLAFNIGAERGTFYVVFAPKEKNETRGVWGPIEVA